MNIFDKPGLVKPQAAKLVKTGKHGDFISKLFHSRNVAHLIHLNTKSFALHKALDMYYNEILDLTDTLAETSFGSIGRQSIVIPEASLEDINTHLTNLRKYIESNRDIFIGSHLQNIIDEVVALIDKTTYLITLE